MAPKLASTKEWEATHKERVNELSRASKKRCRLRVAEYMKGWQGRNPEKRKIYLKRWRGLVYGVIYPERTECGICSKPIEGSQIALDHNQETQTFRGWLCRLCNSGLGIFQEDLNLLRKAAAYLEEASF